MKTVKLFNHPPAMTGSVLSKILLSCRLKEGFNDHINEESNIDAPNDIPTGRGMLFTCFESTYYTDDSTLRM